MTVTNYSAEKENGLVHTVYLYLLHVKKNTVLFYLHACVRSVCDN